MKNRINSSRRVALYMAESGLIAALYVVLTALANAMGLANYAIQLRFSEALCILPLFTPAAVPGLYIGCLIANIMNACIWQDVVFGSLATLLGAAGTYLIGKLLRDKAKLCGWLAGIPTVIANTLIVPHVLKFAYFFPGTVWFFYLTVFLGEVLSAWLLGAALYFALYKRKDKIFRAGRL